MLHAHCVSIYLHAGSDPEGCVSVGGTRRIALRTHNGSAQFEFDAVLGDTSTQEDVFESEYRIDVKHVGSLQQ
jgi:hypothetical protein